MELQPKIIVRAKKEVAYDSPDHLMPWGTRSNNSRNPRFNQKLFHLYPRREQIVNILDMGCSGGGFVKDCLDAGALAVGLEGSDLSKRYRRAEWATIPDFLFTCDITENFEILMDDGKTTPTPVLFDVVTAWELIEHIKTEDLPKVAANVKKHLKPSGLWIMSVSPNEEIINGVQLHQTVKPRKWWIDTFAKLGFTHLDAYDQYFHTQYIRGPKYGAPGSFHLILSMSPSEAPRIPPQGLRWKSRIYDSWLGSKPQKLLRRWLVGEDPIT